MYACEDLWENFCTEFPQKYLIYVESISLNWQSNREAGKIFNNFVNNL